VCFVVDVARVCPTNEEMHAMHGIIAEPVEHAFIEAFEFHVNRSVVLAYSLRAFRHPLTPGSSCALSPFCAPASRRCFGSVHGQCPVSGVRCPVSGAKEERSCRPNKYISRPK